MKKIITLLMLMLCCISIAIAKPIDVELAKRVAANFLKSSEKEAIHLDANDLTDITSTTPFHEFYVFSVKDKGFILVSGDDRALPILGYSTNHDFVGENIPTHVRWWLDNYEKQLTELREGDFAPNPDVTSQWQLLIEGGMDANSDGAATGPLIATTWNQSPYYNNLCPTGTPTGCVATATAQVMKYWNWPVRGMGSHSYTHSSYGTLSADFNTTYDWENMPNWLSSTSTAAQVEAVAKLIFHVGVALEMYYAPGGSTAYTVSYGGLVSPSAEDILPTYFLYDSSTIVGVAEANYTSSDWINLLKNEIDNHRPMLFRGSGSYGGHSFVCDGYNASNQFHFNWGWGGSYDGYFTIGSLNPGGYSFNSSCWAVIGIQPSNRHIVTATPNPTAGGTVTGAGSYSDGSTCTLTAMPAFGYEFTNWTCGNTVLSTNATYSFTVNEDKTILANFTISANNCSISFANLPYTNNFDSYTTSTTAKTGVEPTCWSLAHQDVAMTNAYKPMIYYSPEHAHSGNYSLILNKRGIYAMPRYEGNINTLQLQFYVKQTALKNQLQVGVMSDPSDASTFVPVDTIDNSTYTASVMHTVSFYSYSGTGHYIAFRNTLAPGYSGEFSCNYIDDLTLSLLPTYTVSATSDPVEGGTVIGTGEYTFGSSCTLIAMPATGYSFSHWAINDTIEISGGTFTNVYYPTNAGSPYSYTQQIYYSSQLDGARDITGISYHLREQGCTSRTIDVYLAETSQNAFSTVNDYIPLSELQLVYSGTFSGVGNSWVDINFDNVFHYTGEGNLVVAFDDNTGLIGTAGFATFSRTSENNCAMHFHKTTDIDPASPNGNPQRATTVQNDIRFISDMGSELPDNPIYTFTVTCNKRLKAYFTPVSTCSISSSDLPYTDNFDSYTTSTTAKTMVEPPCWTLAHQDVEITDAYRPMVYYASANAHSGNYSLILNKRGIYAMPEYNGDVSTLQLKFYVKQSALKYQLQVGVLGSLNNADSFTPVATIDNTTTNSEFVTVDFANYTGGGHYIAFRNILASGYTGNFSLNYIDDLTLELRPANSCGISASDLPYTDNFDSYTTSTTAKTGIEPPCWTLAHQDVAITDAYRPMVYYAPANAHSGNDSLILNKRGIYAMPEYDGDVSTLQLKFYVKQSALKYQLQVGVLGSLNNADSFTPVATIDNTTTNSEFVTVDFANYTGGGHYIAFRNILASGYTGNYSLNYIDDLTLELSPTSSCSLTADDLPYIDNFDSYTFSTIAKTGVEPPCWTLAHQDVAITDAYRPMIYYAPANAHSGNYSLILNKRGIYAMPEFDGDVSTLQLQFYVKQTALKYQLQVGVLGSLNSADSFTPVVTIDNASTTVSAPITVNFSAYSGTGRYIAFRNILAPGYTGDYSLNYIDDLALSQVGSASNMDEDGAKSGGVSNGIAAHRELSLYPNPTTGMVNVEADEEVLRVDVYDYTGRRVATFENQATIDLGRLATGIYTLRMTLPERIEVRRVVKQ